MSSRVQRRGHTPTPRLVYARQLPLDPASLPPELQLAQFDPDETGELADVYARPRRRERLRALLDAQHYRLVHWRDGPREINYRRFFDVNDLVARARRGSGGLRRRRTRSLSRSCATA